MLLFFLIAILSWLVQMFLPWWSMIVVTAALCFFMGRTMKQVFFAGFFGCGLVWPLYGLYINAVNGSLMTDRMSNLFSLPGSWLLFLVSFLVAAIAGSIAAAAGYSLKLVLKR
jgi:hypothetical protein